MTEIRGGDLRFTPTEAAVFIQQVMGLDISAKDVMMLEIRTEGWITGLQLAAISMQGREDRHDLVEAFAGSHRYVLDYLAEEVLDRQPEHIRDFLVNTAVLDRLTASLCDEVTGQSDSRDTLRRLEQANLFLVPLDDRREWYRYHHLFAGFLRTELAPQRKAFLHQKATRWFEAHGFLAEAVKHALAAGDLDEAERIIGPAAGQALQRGELATVLGWLDTLPEARIRTNGELVIYKGWALYLAGQVQAAVSCADLAEAILPQDASPIVQAGLIGLRCFLAAAQGDDVQILQLIGHAHALLEKSGDLLQEPGLAVLANALEWLASTKGTSQELYEAVHVWQQHGHHLAAATGMGEIAIRLNRQGRRRDAVLLCQDTIAQYADAQGKPLPLAGIACVALGMANYEANDLPDAQRYLNQGLVLCQQLSMSRHIVGGKQALARLQQAIGETEAAFTTIRDARRIASRMNDWRYIVQCTAVEADLEIKRGNPAAAERWATSADWSRPLPSSLQHEPAYYTYARLLVIQGQPEEAMPWLANLERWAQEEGFQRSLITIYILQAMAHEALERRSQALKTLVQALTLATPENYRRAFLDEGEPIITLLTQIIRSDSKSDLLCHAAKDFVIQLLDDAGAKSAPDVQPLADPLTRRELEVLQLVASGLSNREIAERLVITLGTVKSHVHQIYVKLNVGSRTQAVARAREFDLL